MHSRIIRDNTWNDLNNSRKKLMVTRKKERNDSKQSQILYLDKMTMPVVLYTLAKASDVLMATDMEGHGGPEVLSKISLFAPQAEIDNIICTFSSLSVSGKGSFML